MPSKTSKHTVIVLLLLLLGSLAPPLHALDTDWQFRRDVAYDGWTTYAWGPAQQQPEGHPLAEGGAVDRKIREAVEAELANKGFRPIDTQADADAGTPDFRIVYRTTITERMRETNVLSNHAPDVSWPVGTTRVRGYSEGTLLIEIAAGDEVVWSGWASDVAKRPRKLEGKAEKAVRKILSRFPPKR